MRRRQQGRPGPAAPDRTVLRQLVRAAAGSSTGWEDFTEHLRKQGVHVRVRMSERNPGQMTGYAVALPDRYEAGEAIWFGGGKLAPDLTLPQLHRRWHAAEHLAKSADAVQAGPARPSRPAPADRARDGVDRFGLTRQERQQLWQAAQAATAGATAQITATLEAGADAKQAADAAWAAADLLAVVAHLTGRRAGGPYTDAARADEHAGRDLRRTPHITTSAGRRLRSATTALSALGAVMPSELRQLQALAGRLASLANAVARLRATQAQAAQAAAARCSAEQLHALLPTTRAVTPSSRPSGSGLRSGEVLGLDVDRVDFLRREVRVDRQLVYVSGRPPFLGPPKTPESVRTVPLPGFVVDELAAHLAAFPAGAEGLVFQADKGGPILRTTLNGRWRQTLARAGVDAGLHLHHLRHGYARVG